MHGPTTQSKTESLHVSSKFPGYGFCLPTWASVSSLPQHHLRTQDRRGPDTLPEVGHSLETGTHPPQVIVHSLNKSKTPVFGEDTAWCPLERTGELGVSHPVLPPGLGTRDVQGVYSFNWREEGLFPGLWAL